MSAPLSPRAVRFLPPRVVAFLQHKFFQGIGLGLSLLSLFLFLALLSYHPTDPSWNTASDTAIQNWGGAMGAIMADLFLQMIGLSAFLVVFALGVWGKTLLRYGKIPLAWPKGVFLMIALLAWSLATATLPPALSWGPEASWGGILGISLYAMIDPLVAPVPTFLIGLIVTGIAFLATNATFGLTWKAWQQAGVTGWRGCVFMADRLQTIFFFLAGKPNREFPVPAHRVKIEPKFDTGQSQKRKQQYKTPEISPSPKQADLMIACDYRPPALNLLKAPPYRMANKQGLRNGEVAQNAAHLQTVLEDFNIQGEIIGNRPGPIVTLYELRPAPGVKAARIISLADDIARSMSAVSARIAPVPGRNIIGIELPNPSRETVYLREQLASPAFIKSKALLPLILGKDISGEPIVADLAAMPHLLIAGTTGSGKSVAVNAMILSLLYRMPPEACRFVMIDPKMLELSVYDDIPHLLSPVVTDPQEAVRALKWTVREMEHRYRMMSHMGVRGIVAFNQRVSQAHAQGESLTRRVQTGFDPETNRPVFETIPLDLTPFPLIVVVVDEMADLMITAGKEIEAAIQRLSQMARAAGIHLIMATQRPSVDVITGTIKANFPTRISFQVTSKIDSRTILGEQGAEQLLGQGDMLHMMAGGRIQRVHGPFVADHEVEKVVAYLRTQGIPQYSEDITREDPASSERESDLMSHEQGDSLYDQAVHLVAREGKASTSFIQRHLQIGYNRAASLIERMESEGVIGPANHVGKREVFITDS